MKKVGNMVTAIRVAATAGGVAKVMIVVTVAIAAAHPVRAAAVVAVEIKRPSNPKI